MATAEQKRKNAERMRKWREEHPERKEYERKYHARRSLSPEFRAAAVARASKWMREHREQRRITALSIHLRYNFGIEIEDYLSMVEAQKGRCAICGTVPNGRLCVDHDHDTGEVRGLLCRKCNAAIGLLKDDPALVEQALNYLNDYK